MYPHTLEYGNFHITPQLDSNSLHKYPTNPPQFPCNSPANPPTKCRPACGQMPFHTPLHPQMHTPLRKDIPPAMKYNLPFTQSRLRLLGQKNNLDGELLLLAILRMSNVVRQAPSLWRLFFHPPLPPHPPFVLGKSFPFRRMSFFMQSPATAMDHKIS